MVSPGELPENPPPRDWTSPMTKIILRSTASFLMAALAMNPGIIPS